MGLPKKLTPMQIKFANLRVSEEGRMTATECAIKAGYSEDTAHVIASRLQNPRHFPLVVEYIGNRRNELLKKYNFYINDISKDLMNKYRCIFSTKH